MKPVFLLTIERMLDFCQTLFRILFRICFLTFSQKRIPYTYGDNATAHISIKSGEAVTIRRTAEKPNITNQRSISMENKNNIVSLFETEVLEKIGQRDRDVIKGRFGIGTQPPKTLEEIGSSFETTVTRERVRQIQESAILNINRISDKIPELKAIREKAEHILKTSNDGVGVMSQERLISEVIKAVGLPENDPDVRGTIDVLLHAEDHIGRSRPILGVRPYFYDLSNMRLDGIKNLRKIFVGALPKEDSIPVDAFFNKISDSTGYAISDIAQIVELFPEVVVSEGHAALEKSKVLNPKTLRDKSTYILKHNDKQPMHFRDIAKAISAKWPEEDGKPVKDATVHNELIRNEEFVLVGRGIYALRSWGYQPGTVLDIVMQILRNAQAPMSVEDITKSVRKKRTVKDATVYMNLQNKEMITRVGRKLYALKEDADKMAELESA